MENTYNVSPKIIENYAKVMVNYALNSGKGIGKGETVWLMGQECSKPLFMAIAEEIWKAGGHVILRYLPDEFQRYGLNRTLLEIGTDDQLDYHPHSYWKGIADSADHLMFILASPNINALEGIPSSKISRASSSMAPFMQCRTEKELLGKQFWTLCLYGTESAAKEANMSLKEYWEQIIDACYLNEEDPIAKWKEVQAQVENYKSKLDALSIEKVHIQSEDIDLHILLGKNRKWLGGSGHNIPSFEIFTSPDWRGTNGTIKFNQPLYYSGKKISGIMLKFENGLVVESTATENEDALKEMIAQENANRVGEFSMTDSRHSKITKFMANTLYDENIGGQYGNTHIALGNAYKDAFSGDMSKPTPEEWETMGFNNCPKVHTDMVSTVDRTVTATLADGSEKVIYKDGQFMLD